ncbi:MurR/RpiR family transcriptional regulator [Ruegeria sp. Ofav3-42]|uniref:MurR/RpiR family transcriptional regulator n=1 Tax=Ruegeria sp. Ofav3-42 TaxID=2917759 RepID=UPI001EF6C099|nr:MurR/RpiR family transcriptional regulator [Ruegeria sp. Ofav3-42]MCG7522526.1 MurR/RpiR family transcriptional regulator [Ruegeria sp. Ofav3-42]
MNTLQSLRSALPELPKKLALAARYALEHPDQMALNSMRRTATEVGVTSTTMLRLARFLGFDSYDDFRASFQADLVRGVFGARAGALHEGQDDSAPDTLAEKILVAAENNIRTARSMLDQDHVDQVANLMRAAPDVYLIGSGSLFWLASMMKNTGNMVLPNLRLVGAEYSVAAEALGTLSSDDVVIGFGMNPTALRTVEAMQFARRRNAHTVAITDRADSYIAATADFVFYSNTSTPHYYPSATPLMAIVEVILATVVARGDGRELARIKEFETTRDNSDRYIEY